MKKQLLKSALIAVAGVGLLAGSAMATLSLEISDGSTPNALFTDQGSGDNATALGKLSVVTSYSGWDFIATIGKSNNASDGTLSLDWNLSVESGEDGSNPITLTLSDQYSLYGYDFSNFTNLMNASNIDDTLIATYKLIISDGATSAPYVPGTITEGINYSQLLNTTSLDESLNWTISMIVTISGTSQAEQSLSLDAVAASTAVPEPTTMLLFGTGIVGLTSIARRRKTN